MTVLRIDLDDATTVIVDTSRIGRVHVWPESADGERAGALSHVLMLLTTRWLDGDIVGPRPWEDPHA